VFPPESLHPCLSPEIKNNGTPVCFYFSHFAITSIHTNLQILHYLPRFSIHQGLLGPEYEKNGPRSLKFPPLVFHPIFPPILPSLHTFYKIRSHLFIVPWQGT